MITILATLGEVVMMPGGLMTPVITPWMAEVAMSHGIEASNLETTVHLWTS